MSTVSAYTHHSASDEQLIHLLQQGNNQVFSIICERYNEKLFYFLNKFTGNVEDSRDLVQETFLRVYKSRMTYQPVAKFSTWIYTIAMNLAKSHFKKGKRMPMVSIHEDESDPMSFEILIEDEALSTDEALHIKWSVQKVKQALDVMPEEFKRVIVLRDIEQKTYEEICELTGMAMGTVKSRINRGRHFIKQKVGDYVNPGT